MNDGHYKNNLDVFQQEDKPRILSEFNTALAEFQKKVSPILEDDKHNRGSYASWLTLRKETKNDLSGSQLSVTQYKAGTCETPKMITILRHNNGYWEMYATPIFKDESVITPKDAGGLITYYKRYCYTSILGLATTSEKTNDIDKKDISRKIPPCPQCGAPLQKKQTKTGRVFYGCSTYDTTGCKGYINV